MNWEDNESWDLKFKRLLKRIDTLSAEGKSVGLVGASAGASAAINAFAERKNNIVGCVLVAGKVNRPETVGARYINCNPSFIESLSNCQKALSTLGNDDRKHILSRYALADETVHKPDSRIPGANNRIVPCLGHFFTIATQISIGAPSFIRFLKQQ